VFGTSTSLETRCKELNWQATRFIYGFLSAETAHHVFHLWLTLGETLTLFGSMQFVSMLRKSAWPGSSPAVLSF
jgi:hypothetical protein